MKYNSILKKFISKNKFILLIILAVLLIVYFMSSFREGLENSDSNMDQYKYLYPPPANNMWSQQTMNDFAKKFNEVNNRVGAPGAVQPNAQFLSTYMQNMLEEEAQYYIQNGKFVLDSYITDYLTKNPPNLFGETQTVDQIAALAPNRLVYDQVLYRLERAQSPQPLSYQIYKG